MCLYKKVDGDDNMQNLIQRNFRIIGVVCCFLFSVVLIGCSSNNTSSKPVIAPVQSPVVSPVVNTPPLSPTTEAKTNVEKPKPITSNQVTGQGPNGEGIKGHTDKKGVKIYHFPGDPYYSRTTHVSAWFFTEKDAQAAGYRHIK